jgi:uncharacterized protein (TIRG00374 family)
VSVWLGVAFGLGCLVFFARNAHWEEIGRAFADARPGLIIVSSAGLLMTSVARAWRWKYLLGGASVSFRHRFTSTLIGFAGNNTLPGRLGEPLRCWVLSRLDRRVSFWKAAGSIVVERMFDLAAALALLVIFLVLAPYHSAAAVHDTAFLAGLRHEAFVIGIVLLVVFAGLALFARSRLRAGGGWYAAILARLGSIQEGFAGLRSLRAAAIATLYTVALWTSMVFFEFLMMRAFGLVELGPAHAIGLLVVLAFAIALPQAPAGVGVVQLATETTLTALYGLPPGRAEAFAIGLWLCQVTVVVGAGAVALWVEGLSLADVQRARGSIEDLQATIPAE